VDWKAQLFCWSIVILPIIQFLVFYVYVNFNSIMLAFKEYKISLDPLVPDTISWIGFKNFTDVWRDLFSAGGDLLYMTGNSLIRFLVNLLLMPIKWLFAYAIWKKIPASGFFKVVLFLPSIIPGLIWTTVFRHILLDGLAPWDLLSADKAMTTDIVYASWLGLTTSMILYWGQMSNISPSVIESAKIDGAGDLRIFIKIVFPVIYPTITIFIVQMIPTFFSNQGHLFEFFGAGAPEKTWTLGYYFFVQVISESSMPFYPYASAAGLIFTLIAAPLTLFVRWAMEKFGPSED
jgi:ABC-type sugar transport system permease subunit